MAGYFFAEYYGEERFMNKIKKTSSAVTALLLFFLLLICQVLMPAKVAAADSLKGQIEQETSVDAKNQTEQETQADQKNTDTSPAFKVTMLNVGQGLSILVESDGHYMLYDGGGKKRSSYVVSYLKKHKITNLDYIFASHYDEDHINGLNGVMNALTVQTAVTPDYEVDSDCYHSFRKNLELNKIPELHPEEDEVYPLGSAKIRILYADPTADPENNRSTVIRISCKDYSCLITGDAEAQVERDLIASGKKLDSDLYVVGHHGSASSNTEEFIKAVSPTAAFISVGKDNTYGHPAPETMTFLREQNCSVYRSDKQKETSVSYNGKEIVFSQDPWIAATEDTDKTSENADTGDILDPFATNTDAAASGDRSMPSATDGPVVDYVINVNTGKFHYSDCKSVKQMKDKNKREVECNRAELISQGFEPCQNCNP